MFTRFDRARGRNALTAERPGGFTLLEVMIVLTIIGIAAAIAATSYQRHGNRARAAGVAIQAAPIQRAVEEAYSAARSQYRIANATDGSLVGCQAPAGSTCGDSGATPAELILAPEKLLITGGTIRVSAAPCHVDCPNFALSFSSDMNVVGTVTPPAAPAATPPAAPADSAPSVKDKGAAKGSDVGPPSGGIGGGKKTGGIDGGRDRQANLEASPGQSALSGLVASAHAAASTDGAGADYQKTNNVLYEFGELMRQRVHASDNAACLFASGPCTVTIKY